MVGQTCEVPKDNLNDYFNLKKKAPLLFYVPKDLLLKIRHTFKICTCGSVYIYPMSIFCFLQ